jgi:hypothetical protein
MLSGTVDAGEEKDNTRVCMLWMSEICRDWGI